MIASEGGVSKGDRRQVALVTGAAAGLGQTISQSLLEAGYDVVLADLDEARLGDVSEMAGPPGRVLPVALDLRREESIERVLVRACDAFGPPDLLVNNAGVALHRPAVDLGWADWDAVLDVNLKGGFFMSCAYARRLIAADLPGAIVNVSSTHGLVGIAGRAAYGISKAGVAHMTKMLAIEWAGRIRVNAVAPGTVLTPSREALLADPGEKERMLSRIPAGRFPAPEEVAAAVIYLAGEAAASITGHVLVVDGGTTVW